MKLRRIVCLCMMVIAPVWSATSLWGLRHSIASQKMVDKAVTIPEVQIVLHMLICLIALWIGAEVINEIRQCRMGGGGTVHVNWAHHRIRLALLGVLAVTAHGSTTQPQNLDMNNEVSVPISLLLSPSVATLLLKEILRRRREQISSHQIPDEMSIEELMSLSTVRRIADSDMGVENDSSLDEEIAVVSELLTAVDRREHVSDGLREVTEPSLIVRVYGYPEVTSLDGRRAEFRKKRALELVVWLALNRDRPRRSAARTAIWDVDVNDSTFSTIVSDMRRGIADVEPFVNRCDLVPTTYSDELMLSPRVVTDYDLLVQALGKFRANESEWKCLSDALQNIRDAPFSGTSYEWADLDGTTTRLIITAMQAAQELAEYAVLVNNTELMLTAVSAGLRVMPGCEELLMIQRSFLASTTKTRTTI